MAHKITRFLVLATLFAFGLEADEPRCTQTAKECDQQIRQMLSGCRFLGMTVDERNNALVITNIVPKGPAERSGLKVGDRLIAVNGKSLTNASPRDFKQTVADARSTCRLWMIISRRGAYTKLEARLEPYSKAQIDKIISAHVSQSHTTTAGGH
ncbi:MAG TPA: PDZ domain-containing protein [Thermoanaerobaculia bacterium]